MKHLIHHVRKEIWHNHLFDYLLIATGAILFILGVRVLSGMPGAQAFLFVAFTVFYICWGIYHHIVTKTMRLKVMLEYLLIGSSIIFLALTLINY